MRERKRERERETERQSDRERQRETERGNFRRERYVHLGQPSELMRSSEALFQLPWLRSIDVQTPTVLFDHMPHGPPDAPFSMH